MRTRDSEAVAQFRMSCVAYGDSVNQMPASTITYAQTSITTRHSLSTQRAVSTISLASSISTTASPAHREEILQEKTTANAHRNEQKTQHGLHRLKIRDVLAAHVRHKPRGGQNHQQITPRGGARKLAHGLAEIRRFSKP